MEERGAQRVCVWEENEWLGARGLVGGRSSRGLRELGIACLSVCREEEWGSGERARVGGE